MEQNNNQIDTARLYREPYCVKGNCLCKKTLNKNKPEPDIVPLCNFAPYIVRQIIVDSGGTNNGFRLVISGIDASGRKLKEITVDGSDVDRLDWIKTQWGCENRLFVVGSVKDHILSALYSTATAENKSVHYAVTGWRKIDGEYRFLMPGDEKVTVELDGKLRNYGMVHTPATQDDLILLKMMTTKDFAPPEVMLPLVAFTFMSPLHTFMYEAGCEPKSVLMLVGRSGSLKSTLAALMLCFFGDFTSTSLPMSFKDTSNVILYYAHALKDVPTVIDDFHPSLRSDEKNMTSAAQVITRGWGNRSGRGRLNPNCTPMDEKYPQGDAIITAEFPPDVGLSGTARIFAVDMIPGCVNMDMLSFLQEEAKKNVLQRCMFSYLEWIREKFLSDDGNFRCKLKKEYDGHRESVNKRFRDMGVSPHLRVPEDAAAMTVGYSFFLQFLSDSKCITEDELIESQTLFEDVIFDLARKQNASIEEDKPAQKFVRKLHALLESGRYCVVNKNEERTSLPSKCLGYYDEDNYYLFKTESHRAVRSLCEDQGEAFTISEDALVKALATERLINTDRKQFAKNVRIGKETKRLIELPKENVRFTVEQSGPCVSGK